MVCIPDKFFDQGIFRRRNFWRMYFLTGETYDQRIFWPTNFPNYEFLTNEFQPTNFFDEFWFFGIFFLTYNLFTIASFRIGVPSILFKLDFQQKQQSSAVK